MTPIDIGSCIALGFWVLGIAHHWWALNAEQKTMDAYVRGKQLREFNVKVVDGMREAIALMKYGAKAEADELLAGLKKEGEAIVEKMKS
jgi:hypothetical protein